MGFLKNAAIRDGLILTAAGLVVFGLAHHFNAFEFLVGFLEEHEDWQADEALLALLTAGLMGFIYAGRRLAELKRETRQRGRAEEEAVWFAYHDPLTRLANRHFLEARLKDGNWGILNSGAVIAIDLDGFKKVNDLVGHHGGDELLVTLSERMIEAFPSEVIIRLGGDEFLLVTPSTGDGATQLCDRLLQVLGDRMVIAGIQVDVGASIGVAPLPSISCFEEAMQHADLAMYAAKRKGRNTICIYDPSLRTVLDERVEIEKKLRAAISNRDIRPHYQPVIGMETGVVLGFEALARWTLKDGTSIPPMTFIEVAEEAGLITELSEQLLHQACLDAALWPSDTYLAFNLSPTQLKDRLLGSRIIKILLETGLPAERLEIEVTESAVVRDLDAAMAVVVELRTAGIRIALDDFGTGFSSLSQLSNIPFDKIKIDRSFVSSFEANEKQAKIVKSIVGLGQGLGVETTAEGIERESQYEHLKLLGCEYGQGYLFGKAMPADEVLAFISTSSTSPSTRYRSDG
ncbi:EAL domain-containing protein [Agrobacterium vitis]|uniref:putative bifunctional diguanylate cyclase/phosphodiesterase n=1 Tax=Agrobacterium vitis TaxID=373 RepID=UPI0012E781F0|nr:EAL domain-containing protein [Agrobacterium vitis]MVA23879.1 EAL domain-containing protein [Agrobacterium vitis]